MSLAGTSEESRDGAVAHVVKFGRMVKFEHTLFALPFALAAAAIAARAHGITVGRVAGIIAGDGRRADRGHGVQPHRRPAHRRPQPAHGAAARSRPA